MDSSPGMIAEARRQGTRAGITNIRWRCMPAEEVSNELGPFRLIARGNAFH